MSYNVMSKTQFREIAHNLHIKPEELLWQIAKILGEQYQEAVLFVRPDSLMIAGKELPSIAYIVFRATEQINTMYSEAF